ncbi:MAG: hypothetical protein R2762_00830 [Bryobacteraceae bacterium]
MSIPARLVRMRAATAFALGILTAAAAFGQQISVRPAPTRQMPGEADSNSPGHWLNDTFRLYNSNGFPIRTIGQSPLRTGAARAIQLYDYDHAPMWIESTWVDPSNGYVYAWYHHEPGSPCPSGDFSAPEIGALYSDDDGNTFHDLGIVLQSGAKPDCNGRNGFFAGGHGDFTVLLDRESKYFFFLFSNYGGDAIDQGVAIARMAFEDRGNPVGKVFKFRGGSWNEPGLGGRITPIHTARAPWNQVNTDAFWGPSVHWNTAINQYVMLLNRSCCEPGWPQEGVYVSTSPDISNPFSWSEPSKILDTADWYPQVLGTGPGESDKLAGRVARLFVGAFSQWEIVFGE